MIVELSFKDLKNISYSLWQTKDFRDHLDVWYRINQYVNEYRDGSTQALIADSYFFFVFSDT